MGKRASTKSTNSQRALVIGISEYTAPIPKLPAVAADVREMAKLLGSKQGAFRTTGVGVLADKQATRQRILDNLENTLSSAGADETVFVYLAGHGGIEGNEYFFVASDTDGANLKTTGVPLREIKSQFDRTPSRRVFLWLDFCHSGGILARNANADGVSAIRRILEVVKGHGKVIVAACTSGQSAYEDPAVGHGLFTHALLRGLQGEAKSAQGEITALSLYEFIDHEVANSSQQPVFFGEMTGRIVLMHYPDRGGTPSEKHSSAVANTPLTRPKKNGTWIMLGDQCFLAENVRHSSEGKLDVAISAASGDEEAALSSHRPDQYGGKRPLPFAVNNDAYLVKVDRVETNTTDSNQVWTFSLSVENRASGADALEANVNGISPDEIARRRAGRILLNDPPPPVKGSHREIGSDSFIEGFIAASSATYPVRECVIRSIFQQHGQSSNWKELARLKSIFLLKVTGTIEHVLELTLGDVKNHQIPVKFRGRRLQRYNNVAPETIEISGSCPLG